MNKAIQIQYDHLFEKKCKFASIAGFDCISVNFSGMVDKTEDDWKKAVDDIQRILAENKLFCHQSHPYYYNLLLSMENTEDRFEFAIESAIKASGLLGAGWVALHPRSAISDGYSTRKAIVGNREVFSKYLEIAKKYNTGLAIENLPTFNGLVPIAPFFSSDPEDLMELVDSFNDKSVGVCWDTGHANLMRMNQPLKIRMMGDRIKCTHIHNNGHKDDDHLPPDQGDINWEEIMRAFRDINYKGALTLETHCRYEHDIMLQSFAKHNLECLKYLEWLFNN